MTPVRHQAVGRETVEREASTSAHAAPNVAFEPATSTDLYAPGLLDARLGRSPQDTIEAAIVLEAWDGRAAGEAIASAGALVNRNGSPVLTRGHFEADDELERNSVVGEALALVLSILSVAAWASPLSIRFGAHPLAQAIRVSLPVAIAVQWMLRSRYLSRRHGLSLLARDAIPLSALMLLIDLPLICTVSWGPLAALMITIWAAGTILTRRGWGLVYAAVLAGGTVALRDLGDPYLPLSALACITTLLCAAALLTRRTGTDERSGGVSRALLAGTLGGGLGLLLVADPSLGWGVRGSYPALALLPAVLGSFWGGYHLWDLYEAIPRGLRGVPLDHASRVGLGDPAMRVFAGAVARLITTATVLSAALLLLPGSWIGGTDAVSVFMAFGAVSLTSMVVSLMESLSLQRVALIGLATALATEAAVQYLAHWRIPGAALAAGASAGLILTVPPMVGLLARSGRVLATTMWIR